MPIKTIFFTFSLLLLFTCSLMAQSTAIRKDTTANGDTIIIYKAPLVINKKVFLEDTTPEPVKKYYIDFLIGGGLNYPFEKLKNSLPYHSSYSTASSAVLGGILNKQITSRISIGVGVQMAFIEAKQRYTWLKKEESISKELRIDTLDIYVVTNPMNQKDTLIYLTEQSERAIISTQWNETNYNYNNKAMLIDFPIQLRLMVFDKGIQLSVLSGIVPSVVLYQQKSKLKIEDDIIIPTPKLNYWSFGGIIGLEIAKRFSDNAMLFSQLIYKKTLLPSVPAHDFVEYRSQVLSLNIGLRKFF